MLRHLEAEDEHADKRERSIPSPFTLLGDHYSKIALAILSRGFLPSHLGNEKAHLSNSWENKSK
jgi:hypothetical protein